MKTLTELTDETILGIRTVLKRFGHPVLMSSFGKDSMVILNLVREAGFDLPVIYFRDPWQNHKHIHADKVIREMGLTVHNWPPSAMGIKFSEEKQRLEFVARFNVSDTGFIDVPKNIAPQLPRQKLLCGLFDIIRRPVSVVKNDWDVIIHGHKSSDVDQYYGNVPLEVDLKIGMAGQPAIYFPLRNWSDEQVWEYLESNHIDFQKDRYQDRKELDDKSFNNDYVQCCSKCLDPRNGESVMCPKFGKQISSVYNSVPHFDEKPSYIGEENDQ